MIVPALRVLGKGGLEGIAVVEHVEPVPLACEAGCLWWVGVS